MYVETTIYFDLDGTLLTYDRSFRELFKKVIPVPATNLMAETYSVTILDSLENQCENPYENAFSMVCDEYNIDINARELADTYIESEVRATHVSDDAIQLLKTLCKDNQVGILTNGDTVVQKKKIKNHGLHNIVNEVIISNDVGIRKPDSQIFNLARDRLPAKNYIYIGDTVEEDIFPAVEAGYTTVYIGSDQCPPASITADSIDELANVLIPILTNNK